MTARMLASYVLPVRWTDDSGFAELTDYLVRLSTWIQVVVVDGSPEPLFSRHADAWGAMVDHRAPSGPRTLNGKVRGVVTGLRVARHNAVVLADEDVRYERESLDRLRLLLTDAHLVRPQNYFEPRPWHAKWDTARTLINRVFGSDFPGTLGVRRDFVLRMGGYDGNVLFENLELIRTVRAAGGREKRADDLYVRRRPSTVSHFLEQRVRQAYDDFAEPLRLACELAFLPVLLWCALKPRRLAAALALTILLAEAGRRRAGGSAVWPVTSALWAPLWMAERAITIWLAVAERIAGGARYSGRRIAKAAHSQRQIEARLRREGLIT